MIKFNKLTKGYIFTFGDGITETRLAITDDEYLELKKHFNKKEDAKDIDVTNKKIKHIFEELETILQEDGLDWEKIELLKERYT